MKLRGKIWFEEEAGHLFGRGRAELLEAIEREGSIQGAARRMGLSYRHAWTMLKTSEERWGRKLVCTTRGGRSGGGSRLTEAGRVLLSAFRRVEAQMEEFLARQSREVEDLGS